ncbi:MULTISPECIES: putative heavy metal-binding protein [Listeria]|uniref:putative heavy metal-binding protein n=1 Tax=Listeria TaxID=1637 RepID=UPI000B597D58|nr:MULTISPECIES: putative heavy metal-binding protein [Listeria]
MITTTSPNIEGQKIVEYKKIVFGEVITGVNFVKDIGAGLRNFFGGRSQGYEDELIAAREEAIREMENRAEQLGANAIIGVDIDYEVLGADNGMLMVTASGTAVVIEVQDY